MQFLKPALKLFCMKILRYCSVALILLLPAVVFPQVRDLKFTSGQYGFEIDLPAGPTGGEQKYFTLPGYQVLGDYFFWDDEPKQFAAVGTYRPYANKPTLTEAEKANIIAEYKKIVLNALKEHQVMTQETTYSFGNSKGAEIRGVSTFRMIDRLFFVRNFLVELMVLSSESPGFEAQTKVLDSFRLLTKDETIAALKRENMPDELSQVSVGKRPINDLQYAGLNGSIHSIIEESQDSATSPREIAYEGYYNAAGNLTREYSYNRGYPQEITRWGWVAGKRVSSTNTIFYETEQGLTGAAPANSGHITGMMGQKGDDTQYGARHDFSYDAKDRVIEEKVVGPDETMHFTIKYTYSAAGREIKTLDNTAQFLKRIFEVIDQNGNVTEQRVLDFSGRPFAYNHYSYEFDAAGNWTVRRSQTLAPGRGKAGRKPGSVFYRKISYYENKSS